MRDLAEVEKVLSVFPGIGREIERRGSQIIRRIPLRAAPFNLWYEYDEAELDGPVTLVRLFHVRQRQPRLD